MTGVVVCRVDGCGKEAKYRKIALCNAHYLRAWRHEGSLELLSRPTLRERFEEKVGSRARCWLWVGVVAANGYGRLGDLYAHRVSYELHVGPIPDGLQIDHLCGVQRCVNPEHLEAVTQTENLRRAGYANRTTCKRGHSFADAIVVRRSDGRVNRACRTCSADRRKKASA